MNVSGQISNDLLENVDPAPLFEPFQLGAVNLRNRFVMAPMTRNRSPKGIPDAAVRDYYARRSPHIGLIITEATYIDHPLAGYRENVPRLFGDAALEGWRAVAHEVHAAGAKIIAQLWHAGASATRDVAVGSPQLTPSGHGLDGVLHPLNRIATPADLDEVGDAFVRAARAAQDCGMDGVELHGAHGYFLDNFLYGPTNRRDDQYGKTLSDRSRFSSDIVKAIRAEVGQDFLISYRFSQWKNGYYDVKNANSPEELAALLCPIVDAGLDALHPSTRRYWLPEFEGSPLPLAGWIKKITAKPVITVGSVGVSSPFLARTEESISGLSLRPLLDAFLAGEFDLVAVGRALLSDPEWPTKLASGSVDTIRSYAKSHESDPLY